MPLTPLILIVIAAFLAGGLLTAAVIFACMEDGRETNEREWLYCPSDETEKK